MVFSLFSVVHPQRNESIRPLLVKVPVHYSITAAPKNTLNCAWSGIIAGEPEKPYTASSSLVLRTWKPWTAWSASACRSQFTRNVMLACLRKTTQREGFYFTKMIPFRISWVNEKIILQYKCKISFFLLSFFHLFFRGDCSKSKCCDEDAMFWSRARSCIRFLGDLKISL